MLDNLSGGDNLETHLEMQSKRTADEVEDVIIELIDSKNEKKS